MKIETREDSLNYACQVIKLPPKQVVNGLDKLVKVTHQGNDVLVGKDTDENSLYLFFPAECAISGAYLAYNNEFRESTLNFDRSAKGYFEPTGRVKTIKFKGIISTGYIAPRASLLQVVHHEAVEKLKVGDEFTTINGFELCKKYKITRTQGSGEKGESRYNKKLKRFDKLVPNQFRFHVNTPQLAKCLGNFKPDDQIVITSKWHGTSAVFSNVLIKKELTWKEKVAKFFGVNVVDTKYDNLYSSRSVIKNQYINKEATPGYYNEDIWGVVNKELAGKIEQGVTIYGEIVGYLPSGKAIQKDYDYGCDQISSLVPNARVIGIGEHKFVIYRITYTKPDGNTIEFSWSQIKEYAKKYSLETVKELYLGRAYDLAQEFLNQPYFSQVRDAIALEDATRYWQGNFLNLLSNVYLEKDCQYCKNKVPAEGIVIRKDDLSSYEAYKLKSKRFLEKETKELDKGEINIEDEETVNTESNITV